MSTSKEYSVLRVGIWCVILMTSLLPCSAKSGLGTINGRVLASGEPMPDALVRLFSVSEFREGKSDGEGRFQFSMVPFDVYEVEAERPGFMDPIECSIQLNSESTDVSVRTGLNLSRSMRIGVETTYKKVFSDPGSRIVGHLWRMEDGKSPQRPLPKVTVSLFRIDGSRVESTKSDEGGQFEFQVLQPGKYKLKAVRRGYQSRSLEMWAIRSYLTTISLGIPSTAWVPVFQ